jgi:hypothetical protein
MTHCENKLIFNEIDDDVRFVLDQHAELEFYSASSLKQQSADRHVASLGHIILIPSQPVFIGEATDNGFIVIGLVLAMI